MAFINKEKMVCPNCDNEVNVNVVYMKFRNEYMVDEDCPTCHMTAKSLEGYFNGTTKVKRFSVERSYMKVNPRGI